MLIWLPPNPIPWYMHNITDVAFWASGMFPWSLSRPLPYGFESSILLGLICISFNSWYKHYNAVSVLKQDLSRDRVSLCSFGCPGTHSAGQAGLKLTEIQPPLPPRTKIKDVHHHHHLASFSVLKGEVLLNFLGSFWTVDSPDPRASFSSFIIFSPWDRVSPRNPGTCSADQAGFKLTEITCLCLPRAGIKGRWHNLLHHPALSQPLE